jgi:DNA-binding transcriptional LysR family regulator
LILKVIIVGLRVASQATASLSRRSFTPARTLEAGNLVQLLPDWAEERFPLFLYLPTRRLPSAKVRAFLDFARSLADWR